MNKNIIRLIGMIVWMVLSFAALWAIVVAFHSPAWFAGLGVLLIICGAYDVFIRL
jgi:hypothetical protein